MADPARFQIPVNPVGGFPPANAVAGIEAGLTTYLVLTGSTERDEVTQFAYRPHRIAASIESLVDEI